MPILRGRVGISWWPLFGERMWVVSKIERAERLFVKVLFDKLAGNVNNGVIRQVYVREFPFPIEPAVSCILNARVGISKLEAVVYWFKLSVFTSVVRNKAQEYAGPVASKFDPIHRGTKTFPPDSHLSDLTWEFAVYNSSRRRGLIDVSRTIGSDEMTVTREECDTAGDLVTFFHG